MSAPVPAPSSGVWLDIDGQVVETAPALGVQLIAPGCIPSAEDLERVARARAASPGLPLERAVAADPPAAPAPPARGKRRTTRTGPK